MSVQAIALCLFSMLSHTVFTQPEVSARERPSLRSRLVNQIQEIDLSEFSADDAITLCLEVSQALFEADMKDLAADYFQRAITLADKSESRKYEFRLFDHALNTNDWESATKIATASDRRARFLDRLAVAKYRAGDDGALDGFPRAALDFYIALDLADAYAKRRQYEQLEAFVTGIDSLPANEPTDVGAISWHRIATDFRRQGKMDQAKLFIDKAMEIGGHNYYTGYGVRVTRLSIHGGLEEQAEKYAELAVAYRGHHTRELLGSLIKELVAAGKYETAKRTLDYYPSTRERMSGEKYLAFHLAEKAEFAEAIGIVRGIDDVAISASARRLVAGQLLEAGRRETAKTLLLEADALLSQMTDKSAEYQRLSVIRMLAGMNQHEKVMEIIAAAESPLDKGRRMAAALEGLPE